MRLLLVHEAAFTVPLPLLLPAWKPGRLSHPRLEINIAKTNKQTNRKIPPALPQFIVSTNLTPGPMTNAASQWDVLFSSLAQNRFFFLHPKLYCLILDHLYSLYNLDSSKSFLGCCPQQRAKDLESKASWFDSCLLRSSAGWLPEPQFPHL